MPACHTKQIFLHNKNLHWRTKVKNEELKKLNFKQITQYKETLLSYSEKKKKK